MKKLIIALTMLMAFAFVVNAQKCTQYDKGQVVKSSMKTWFCMKTFMPEWAKVKPADKAKFAEEFNNNIESGAEKPAYEGHFETTIEDIVSNNNGEYITVSSIINGVKYTTNMLCSNDTLYIIRAPRISFLMDKGDTAGYSITGIQAIPNKLKVGDVLSIYEDYGATMPKERQWKQQMMDIVGREKVVSYEKGWGVDSRTGESGFGTWENAKNVDIWGLVTVNVKVESQMVMQTKNYVNASVTREEELEIDGKKYKAFVIESQKWTKTGAQNVITSDNERFDKYYEKVSKKIAKKSMKEIVKMGLTNEQGYGVTYMTEWFVPGISVVKSQGYDLNGLLTQRTSWDSLK